MQNYKYSSYQEYIDSQIKANKDKIAKTWSLKTNIKFIARYLIKYNPVMGICHGTRRGNEIYWFEKYLKNCKMIGTEISDTATEFRNTIQHDFHKPLSIVADFIYSNALDHAYDPQKAIKTWYKEIAIGGHLVIEWSSNHEMPPTEMDPFSATLDEIRKLIPLWTDNRLIEKNIYDAPGTYLSLNYNKIIIFQKI